MKITKNNIRASVTSFLVAFAIAFFLTSCNSDPSKKIKAENIKSTTERINNSGNLAEIEFNKSSHDFGEISDGDIVETSFSFTNVGSSDLIISNASGSCGCTVPKKPTAPILPGETGEIEVKYDSKKQSFRNRCYIFNTNGKQLLNIPVKHPNSSS